MCMGLKEWIQDDRGGGGMVMIVRAEKHTFEIRGQYFKLETDNFQKTIVLSNRSYLTYCKPHTSFGAFESSAHLLIAFARAFIVCCCRCSQGALSHLRVRNQWIDTGVRLV